MIDPKYSTRSMLVLTEEEKIREVIKPKTTISVEIFTEDFQLAQQNNLNLSRILRFKFHEWIQAKIQ